MRRITSPHAFKTCHIAQIKEELGLKAKSRIAVNRKGKQRRVRTPEHLRPFLIEAITTLMKETGRMPTYREIQQKAFELYKEKESIGLTERYYGFLKVPPEDRGFVEKIAESEEIFYEGI